MMQGVSPPGEPPAVRLLLDYEEYSNTKHKPLTHFRYIRRSRHNPFNPVNLVVGMVN